MTNQEAIETIKANYPPENYSMLREALDVALALLKEQETVVHPEPSCKMTYITDCCCDLCGVQLIREDNFAVAAGNILNGKGSEMGMTEREDTIERIERVLELTHKKSITVTIPRLTAERAVALLKEQEAHLLSISEIYTAHKLDVWLEEKSDNIVHPLMLVETATDKRQAAFFFPMTVRTVKVYGKTWRCWSARPTDQQRKAVKWND